MTIPILESFERPQTSERKVPNVHEPRTQVPDHDLRALISAPQASSAHQHALTQCVRRSLNQSSPQHQQIVLQAVWLAHDLFYGTSFSAPVPLWVKLVRSTTGGLRQVSKDWQINTDHLLIKLGLESTASLVAESYPSAALAYRLRALKLSRNLMQSTDQTTLTEQCLQLKIRIAEGSLDDDLLREIAKISGDGGHRQSLEASYLVKSHRTDTANNQDLARELQTWVESNPLSGDVDDESILRVIHVANSLNLIYFGAGNVLLLQKNFAAVESRLPKLSDRLMAGHVQGNLNYHQSMLAAKSGDSDTEFRLLLAASAHDPDFTDYDYRLAQILHDRGDAKAGDYYQRALSTSPLFYSLVNDYGCFLSDAQQNTDLDSWTALTEWLAPFGYGLA